MHDYHHLDSDSCPVFIALSVSSLMRSKNQAQVFIANDALHIILCRFRFTQGKIILFVQKVILTFRQPRKSMPLAICWAKEQTSFGLRFRWLDSIRIELSVPISAFGLPSLLDRELSKLCSESAEDVCRCFFRAWRKANKFPSAAYSMIRNRVSMMYNPQQKSFRWNTSEKLWGALG